MNFELPGQTPNFDFLWQQWLARQANVLTTDSVQSISQKTISLSLNFLTGTTAEFNAALSDNDFATLAGIEELSNKTLDSPVINTGDINTPDIDGGTIDDVTLGGTLAGSPTASGVWTFTGSGSPPRAIKISNAFPNIVLIETGVTADSGAWEIKANATEFTVTAKNDALTTGNDAITITRSGIVPDNIDFFVNTITRNGTVVLDRTNTATVTNKSISLASNTLTGNTAQFNTALTDGSFVTDASIGSTVQAYSANLDEYAGVNPTAAGLALLDDADNTAQRTTLGLGTIATQDATAVNIDGGTIDDITLDGTIAGTPTFSGAATFTGGAVFQRVSNQFGVYETDAPTDEKRWTLNADNSIFRLTTRTDADVFIANVFEITRSGNITVTSTDAGSSNGPLMILHRNSASPAASDLIGALRFLGEDDGSAATTYAQIAATIADPADASEDGTMLFQTAVAGSNGTRMTIINGMYMTGATGGDQGAGTINATAVYDDGVLLTDYVPDAYIDGDYSVTDYDSRVPPRRLEDGTIVPRQHAPARLFKTNFDELDPVLYANKWKSSRKLPAFNRGPEKKSTGECIQALLETCEILAVHIDKHETRIQSLEA